MRRLLPLLLVLAGCDVYFGDGGDDVMCGGTRVEGYPSYQLRDPTTGTCEEWGGGSYCDSSCGECPPIANEPYPAWGECYSDCTGLAEEACLASSGCQAAYAEDARIADAPSSAWFTGCWAVAPQTYPPSTSCWEKDAYACAQDDTCAAYYTAADGGFAMDAPVSTQFSRCAPEPSMNGCENVPCGFGSHCELQCDLTGGCAPTCVPDDNACAVVDCQAGYTCVEVCDGYMTTVDTPVPPWQCRAECVPVGGGDPGTCTGQTLCDSLPPACPTGTVPGILNGCWSGYCIPEADCGPNNPGDCSGEVSCFANPPACPTGTVPGVANGCWTGYCIPEGSCPVAMCEALTTEAACTARSDCQAVYRGGNCTCDPACSCEDLTYDHCASGLVMPF
ncbi:MAG TPA: hypothetical protein VM513_25820 [Kofleriaceae bacterium]|jgi:hypothetical protein|nr:hypothetical protein [Kofleriaceae bacterium]